MEFNFEIGDYITIENNKSIFNGEIVNLDTENITLKLNTGYLIGFSIKSIKNYIINIKNKKEYKLIDKKLNVTSAYNEKNKHLKNISLLATGGTISCSYNILTNTITQTLSAREIIEEFPELKKYSNLKAIQVMNKLSENIQPDNWINLAEIIVNEIKTGADGIIVTCGTDTMVYIASAIAYMIETPIPIVFTGSQRSADRPSSDNYMNLICASIVAISDIAEVSIVMHGSLSDDYCFVHRAVKTKKMHTSRRNTFKSINTNPIAKVYFESGKIEKLSNYIFKHQKNLCSKINLEKRCSLIKFHPGLDPDILNYYINKQYKGIILECVGMGHVSDDWIPFIEKATRKEILIVITSQCPYGRVGCNIYESGMKILNAGAIEGEDLLSEVALVKLMWLFGNYSSIEDIKSLMCKNLIGDIEPQEYK